MNKQESNVSPRNLVDRGTYVVVVTVNSKSTCRCDIFRPCHDATNLSKQSAELGEAVSHRVLFIPGGPMSSIDGDSLGLMHPDVRRTVTTKVTRRYVAVSRVFVPVRVKQTRTDWLCISQPTSRRLREIARPGAVVITP